MLTTSRQRVIELLTTRSAELKRLAKALYEYETLSREDII